MRHGRTIHAYRMAGSRTYHLPAENWITTGLAECGFSIARAGFSTEGANAETIARSAEFWGKKLCGHCLNRSRA